MPATDFLKHARFIRDAIDSATDSGEVVQAALQIDQRSATRGFIDGMLYFQDGSQLVFREFLDTGQAEPRLMYAYHYQDATQQLVFRYDNAVHRPALPQLAHKHSPAGIELAAAPSLIALVDQILELLNS
jgi:hypothetical protein